MKNKSYKDNSQFIKKGWIHYPISRGRMLRRAANLMGHISYQTYLRRNNPKRWRQFERYANGLTKTLKFED